MYNEEMEPKGESDAPCAAGDDWGSGTPASDSAVDRQFHALFEAIGSGAILYEPIGSGADCIVGDINSACCELFGVRREQVVGRSAEDAFPAMADTDILDAVRDVSITGRSRSYPPALLPVAQGRKWLENQVSRLPSGGVVVLYEDVTSRLRADEVLKESEARYHALFTGMAAGVAVYRVAGDGEDFIFSDLNPSGARITSIDREQAIGHSVLEVFPGLADIGLIDVFRAVHRDGQPRRHALSEYQDERINLWVENYVYRLPSGEIVAVFEDVTDPKRMEQELRESEQRLLEAQAYAHVGDWRIDAKLTSAYWSDEIYRIFGLQASVPAGPETLRKLVHPDDWSKVMDSLTEAVTSGSEHNMEYRVCCPDGVERWVECRASPVRDLDGAISSLSGVLQDVTQRKRAQEQVSDERRFLQEIIDGIADPVLVIADNFDLLLMNRAARAEAPTEVASANFQKCHYLAYGRDTPCDGGDKACLMQRVVDSGERQTAVQHRVARDGSMRFMEVAAMPLRQRDGSIKGIIEVSRDITAHITLLESLRDKEAKLEHLAHHDALTGLPNRLLIVDRINRAIARARRHNGHAVLMFIDLDLFKRVNDSLGHAVGDELLRLVAGRLSACVRSEDTIGRLGGDEFIVLLEVMDRPQEIATRVATAIAESISVPIVIDGHEFSITTSIGICTYPEDGYDAETMLRNADSAMYKAKDEGRNNLQFYSRDMTAQAFERVLLESSLRNALERDELLLHYQPQIDLRSSRIIGVEALLRWHHSELGMVSPKRFVSLAEDTGLIQPIGEWVFEQACRDMAAWRRAGLPISRVAINISGKQLRDDGLERKIASIIDITGCRAQCLEIEITESFLMHDARRSTQVLRRLRDMGMGIAIDDFGTGYSSLSYLKRLPITKLKIDRSFVRDIPEDANDEAIARAVVALGKSLQLRVLAEGVETEEQKAFLVHEGCDEAQGYLFAKPLPEAELRTFLETRRLP